MNLQFVRWFSGFFSFFLLLAMFPVNIVVSNISEVLSTVLIFGLFWSAIMFLVFAVSGWPSRLGEKIGEYLEAYGF